MKKSVPIAAPALAVALLTTGAAFATPATPLTVDALAPSNAHTSAFVSGKVKPIKVTVNVTGDGPFTWSGTTSYMNGDAGSGRDLDASTPLQAGPNVLTVADTNLLRYGGKIRVQLKVTDKHGKTADSSVDVSVLGKASKPTITSVKRNPARPGTYKLRGKANPWLPGNTYLVMHKPTGKKTYSVLGKAHAKPNGTWNLTTKKLKPGKLYVTTSSALVVRNKKSATTKVPKSLFARPKNR